MIWITGKQEHTTISQMFTPHIKSCIKHITATHKPNDKIYGFKAETWCKEMSKELNNRKIAQLENLKTDLSEMNKQLLAQFNACNDEIKHLKENNNKWDKYPF
jgi:hypothetical protein